MSLAFIIKFETNVLKSIIQNIKRGTLIERDKQLGTMYLSKHAFVDDWDKEHQSIIKERRRIGVK